MAEYPWYNSYDAGVPRTLEPYPQATLLDFFAESVKQKPAYTFLIFREQRITYDQMDKLSDSMAAALVANGIKKGSTVAIILPNCPQYLIAQFGIWKAGGIAVPLNPLYTEDELVSGLDQCGVEVAVIFSPLYRMFKSFQSRHTRLRLLITVSINDYASLSARITYELVRAGQEVSRIATQSGDAKMNDLLKGYAAKRRPAVKALPEDIALLLQSGGTTGTARGIMLSHKAMVAEGAQIKAWTKPILTEWEDPVMITPPLFHVYGNAAIAAAAIMGHNPMVLIPDPRDHKDLIKTIKKTEPAFFPAVPTLFTALANHPDFKSGKMDFKFMKLCLSGAAPFATGARTAFEALTGHRIFQAYGLTETTGAITIEPLGKLGKEGSVGLPLPDVVIKIVDIETGNRDLPNGETGEIIVKCPQVMTGFWNSLEETTEMIKDGWLHTGDIGHLDKDGYLFLTSRKKQLIKVSGFQVWPQEIVEVLKMHPMVEDACVGGIPDPVQGEAVKAWVVLRKGYETNATALQAFCRQKLTAYKIPRYVEFRDSLPRNLYGQELCRKLVEEEKARNAPPHVTG